MLETYHKAIAPEGFGLRPYREAIAPEGGYPEGGYPEGFGLRPYREAIALLWRATPKGWKLRFPTSSKTPLHSKNSSVFLHLWASSSAHS